MDWEASTVDAAGALPAPGTTTDPAFFIGEDSAGGVEGHGVVDVHVPDRDDVVVLGRALPPQARHVPTCVLLHGLTGGSQETYIKWAIVALRRAGVRCVVMNARGCGDTRLATPRCFSAAETSDVRNVVKRIRAQLNPDTPLFCVGFSLGAGILAKYIAEDGEALQGTVTAAVACCGSYDMVKTTQKMEGWFHALTYNKKLASNLANFAAVNRHRALVDPSFFPPQDDLASCSTVRQFDAKSIVPMFGYRDEWHYYTDASSGRLLQNVGIPLLLLNAEDDPVCCVSGIPVSVVMSNPNLCAVVTAEGGHVAWCQGWWPVGPAWCDNVLVDYCQFFIASARGGTIGARATNDSTAVAAAATPLSAKRPWRPDT